MTTRTSVCLGRTLTSMLDGCVLDMRVQTAVRASWHSTKPQFSHSPKNIHMRTVGVCAQCMCMHDCVCDSTRANAAHLRSGRAQTFTSTLTDVSLQLRGRVVLHHVCVFLCVYTCSGYLAGLMCWCSLDLIKEEVQRFRLDT